MPAWSVSAIAKFPPIGCWWAPLFPYDTKESGSAAFVPAAKSVAKSPSYVCHLCCVVSDGKGVREKE